MPIYSKTHDRTANDLPRLRQGQARGEEWVFCPGTGEMSKLIEAELTAAPVRKNSIITGKTYECNS
jgi:hypothetical protein